MASVQERTELRFTGKINAVAQQERGHARPVPGCKWLVQAAHQWGVYYLEALVEAQAEGIYRTDDVVAPLPHPVPAATPAVRLVEDTAKRRAYTRGYMLWYLCGRPKDPKPGYVPGQKTDWWPLTVTDDNAEGSRREDLVKSPSDHCTMELWAERAFYRYAEQVRATSSAPSSSVAAAGSSSAGKRPMVADEPASPKGPRLEEPSAVEPYKSLAEFMEKFMEAPDARHAYKPGMFPDIQRAIAVAHQQNLVIGPFRNAENKMVIGGLPMPQEALGAEQPGMHIYKTLRDTYKINELYDAAGKHLKKPETSWPPAFAQLELEKVGEGGYNTVWQVKENASGAELRKLLPEPVADALIKRKCVLRMPKPSTWAKSTDVALEMSNLMEASFSGFGPSITAMWCGHTVETTPGDGRAKAWFKLFVVMERGTMSVFHRLRAMRNGTTTDKQWKAYLFNLQKCIWWMSVSRCVHLDSKPSNLVDTYPDDIPQKNPDGRLRIKFIDLDSNFYGRIERLTSAEATDSKMQKSEAMGWKPCWLYNVLVMSCNLRIYLKDDVYQKHWWSKIENVVNSVMATVLKHESAHPKDAEYNRALRFLKHANAEWKGDFHWDKQPQGPPSGCKEPETLALIAVDQAKHYCHDEWWRLAKHLLVMPAEEMALAIGAANTSQRDGSTLVEQKRLQDERDQKMNKCQEAWKWYDDEFRSTAVPMIRVFEDELAVPRVNVTKPRQLYEVLKKYAAMTTEDMAAYAYPRGHPSRRKTYHMIFSKNDDAVHQRWPNKPHLNYHYLWVSSEHWSRTQPLLRPDPEYGGSPYWRALRALGFGNLVAAGAQLPYQK